MLEPRIAQSTGEMMRILQDGTDLDGFFSEVGPGRSGILLLDYDGTLAPFREDRDAAVPYDGVRERLERLRRVSGSVGELESPVIISGRPTEEVLRLLDVSPAPEIWGCHGWERRDPDGRLHTLDPGPEVREGLDEAFRVARETAPADRTEHKGAAVAVHFRGLDPEEADRLRSEIEAGWSPIVESREGVELRPFDGGIEIRAASRDKGSAVREILDGVADGVPLAYLGDDLTDEDAFGAVRDAGGLAVLVRPEVRDTEANLWLRPPHELLAFLDRWIERARGGSGSGPTRGPETD